MGCINCEINTTYFWDSVRDSERANKWAVNLLFEKNIHLDDECDSILIIGISLQDRMRTSARIETRSAESVLRMGGDSLINLLDCIDGRFRDNAVFPTHTNISIRLFDERFYKIGVDDARIKMTRDALLTLMRKQTLIRNLMKTLECNEYEKQLFRLLHHFCYDTPQRTVVRALNSRSMHQHVFNEMHDIQCDCLEMSFTLELALNNSNWFAACVPLFIKTLMQSSLEESDFEVSSLRSQH